MKFLRSSERGREEKREGHGKTFVSAAAEQHAASGMEEIEKAGGGKKKDRLEREKKTIPVHSLYKRRQEPGAY